MTVVLFVAGLVHDLGLIGALLDPHLLGPGAPPRGEQAHARPGRHHGVELVEQHRPGLFGTDAVAGGKRVAHDQDGSRGEGRGS